MKRNQIYSYVIGKYWPGCLGLLLASTSTFAWAQVNNQLPAKTSAAALGAQVTAGSEQKASAAPAGKSGDTASGATGANATAEPKPATGAGAASKFEFNLSSTRLCIPAGHHHDFQFADITVAGESRTIVPGDMLTPGEYVALHQVLMTGKQTVQLAADGKAVGGHFRVDPQLELAIKELAQANPAGLAGGTASETSQPGATAVGKRKVIAGSGLSDEEWIQADGTSQVISGTAVKIHSTQKARKRPSAGN